MMFMLDKLILSMKDKRASKVLANWKTKRALTTASGHKIGKQATVTKNTKMEAVTEAFSIKMSSMDLVSTLMQKAKNFIKSVKANQMV